METPLSSCDDDDTDSNGGGSSSSSSSLDVDVAHWRRELPPRKWMPIMSPRDEARMARHLVRQSFFQPLPPGHTKSCLVWTGPDRVRWNGKLWYIRRLVYEICIGTLPATHTCLAMCSAGNKACIEPTHLRVGPRPQPLNLRRQL